MKKKAGARISTYRSLLPVIYAQALTSAIVKMAPANPESIKLVKPPNKGRTLISHGITYIAVTCAITPAINPSRATITNTLSLSLIEFTFLF